MWMLMYFVLWKVCAKKNTYYILLLILMKVPVLVPEPNCICNPYLASVLQACWAQYNTLVCGLCRVGAKKYTYVLLLLMLELDPERTLTSLTFLQNQDTLDGALDNLLWLTLRLDPGREDRRQKTPFKTTLSLCHIYVRYISSQSLRDRAVANPSANRTANQPYWGVVDKVLSFLPNY